MLVDPKSFYFALDLHNSSYIIHLKQVFCGVCESNIKHIQYKQHNFIHKSTQRWSIQKCNISKESSETSWSIKLKKDEGKNRKKNHTITWRALSFDLWRYTKEATHEPRAKLKKERKKKKNVLSPFFFSVTRCSYKLKFSIWNREERLGKRRKKASMYVWKCESKKVSTWKIAVRQGLMVSAKFKSTIELCWKVLVWMMLCYGLMGLFSWKFHCTLLDHREEQIRTVLSWPPP